MLLCSRNAMANRGIVFVRGSCLRSSCRFGWTFVTLLGVICGRVVETIVTPKSPTTCENRPAYCPTYVPWSCPPNNCSSASYTYRLDNNSEEKSRLRATLSTAIYYHRKESKEKPFYGCLKTLNLTWTVKLNDSDLPVVGFRLQFNRLMPSKNMNRTDKVRLFLKQGQTMPVDKSGNTLFYYDCVSLSIASKYRFELFSLHHQSTGNGVTEGLERSIGVTNISTDCDIYPDGHYTPNSEYRGWLDVSPLDRDCSVTAYFTPAPDLFGVKHYDVQLRSMTNDQEFTDVKNLTFTCENFGPVSFRIVSSGSYKITVYPVGGTCPGPSKCTAFHTIFNVNMSNDDCPTTSTAASTNMLALSTSDLMPTPASIYESVGSGTSMHTNLQNQNVIIAIAAVFVASVFVIIAVVILRFNSKKRRGVMTVPTDTCYNGEKEEDALVTQEPVLLIYASDNCFHSKVVHCLAAYLQTHCHCDVRFDQWSQTKISEMSALDWIFLQLKSVKNVIIINSEGGFRQYKASTTEVAYEKVVHESPLEDMFVPAVRELRNGYYLKPKSRKLFKVAFPYTDPEFFVSDFHSGMTYQLMTHIDDLVLNIHGLSKHTRRGKRNVVGISEIDYTKSPEGRALKKAITEATEFFKQNPSWFSDFYEVKPRKYHSDVHSSVNKAWNKEHLALQSDPVYMSLSDEFDSGLGTSIEKQDFLDILKNLPEGQQMEEFKGPDLDDASSVSISSIELRADMLNKDYDNTLF